MSFAIVIIGAGISGLTSAIYLQRQGHDITVYESSAALSEAGAGIQIPPNSFHLLEELGQAEKLRSIAIEPEGVVMRDYHEGEVLREVPMAPMMKILGSSYLLTHRAAYQRVLYEAAIEAGAHVQFGTDLAKTPDRSQRTSALMEYILEPGSFLNLLLLQKPRHCIHRACPS